MVQVVDNPARYYKRENQVDLDSSFVEGMNCKLALSIFVVVLFAVPATVFAELIVVPGNVFVQRVVVPSIAADEQAFVVAA